MMRVIDCEFGDIISLGKFEGEGGGSHVCTINNFLFLFIIWLILDGSLFIFSECDDGVGHTANDRFIFSAHTGDCNGTFKFQGGVAAPC